MSFVTVCGMLVVTTLLLLFVSSAEPTANFTGKPIVLIPGDGGSQLIAKLNKTTGPHYVCYKHTDYWFTLWLNFEELAPLTLDCFVDNIKLHYNRTSRTTYNTPGVQTRVVDFGNTTGVEYLDPSKASAGIYYGVMVKEALTWGYKKKKTIYGAPFDFRKAPNELDDYYANLTKLIENAYYHNGNKKVVVICHSFGNNAFLYFLAQKPQIWKDKFIDKFVSIAAPWGGSIKIMLVLASGYNMDHWRIVIPPSKARIEQRSMPSTAFLLPNPLVWNTTEVLVETPDRNYTNQDYRQFFTDIKFDDGYLMYQDTKDLIGDLPAPGVETHCLYGTGLPTPDRYVYAKGYFPDYQPSPVNGPGDGTVNLRCSKVCERWKTAQKQPVYMKGFDKAEHLAMLQDKRLIDEIKRLSFPETNQRRRRVRRTVQIN